MSEASREQRLFSAFVKLADTLVDDFDTVDLLQDLVEECTDLLDTDAGGVMLTDGGERLHVVASTSEEAGFVEIMQLNAGAGPCIECFTSGTSIGVADIEEETERWPGFSRAALSRGFRSVYATPLILRGRRIGAMNLFSTRVGELNARDIAAARALADVATIGVLQARLIREGDVLTEQLQNALDSRVLIEQAKGVLSETHKIGLDEAFAMLRGYARGHGEPMRSVALSVVDRSIDLSRASNLPTYPLN